MRVEAEGSRDRMKPAKMNRFEGSSQMRLMLKRVWDDETNELKEFEQGFIDSVCKSTGRLTERQWAVAKRIVKKHLGITIDDGTPEEESPRKQRGR